ncbi:MAG TPA: lysophospholipid acyltransferase family protein [Pyrinomonadaceae bacterium]
MKESTTNKYPAPIVIEAIRIFGITISKIFWRIRFYGTENIPQNLEGGLLVVPNHQTYFDPFWVCIPIRRRYRFMAWEKAFEWFLVGDVIRYLGAFPVNLERGSKESLKQAVKALRDGATLMIFPEGAREFSDGKMLEFKSGAIKIAMLANVPILPVTIRGANKVWAQDMKFPRFGKVEIFYHPVMEIPRDKDSREQIDKLTDKLEEIIKSKM